MINPFFKDADGDDWKKFHFVLCMLYDDLMEARKRTSELEWIWKKYDLSLVQCPKGAIKRRLNISFPDGVDEDMAIR